MSIEHYNSVYSQYDSEKATCHVSIHDIDKARNRLKSCFDFFKIPIKKGGKALDIGCGLGYYAEVLCEIGFNVTAIDFSEAAIKICNKQFSGPNFIHGCFPEDIMDSYDFILISDLGSINTFDLDVISRFIETAFQKLNKGGVLVICWHTNFSGKISTSHWSNWNITLLRKLRRTNRLTGPAIVETKYKVLNFIAIIVCKIFKKSAPVFLVHQNQ